MLLSEPHAQYWSLLKVAHCLLLLQPKLLLFSVLISPSSLQISGNLTVPWITGCSRKRAVSIFPFKHLIRQTQEWEVYLNAFLEISSLVVHSIIFFLPCTSFLEIVSFFCKAPSHYHLMTFSNIKQAGSALEYSLSSWLRWFHNTSLLERRNLFHPHSLQVHCHPSRSAGAGV